MDMDNIEEILRQRFTKAIKKTFEICPLIGPKWLRSCPSREQADFEFIGIPKLAKAMGMEISFVEKLVLKNLDKRGIDAEFALTATGKVRITLRKKTGDEEPQ